MYHFREYKGRRVISLDNPENPNFPFVFGDVKARLIQENLEGIKKFALEPMRESARGPREVYHRPPKDTEEDDDIPF